MFMAKIYIRKEDKKRIKEIIFNKKHDSNDVITFEKKYVGINSYLFSTNIFPNVLIPIIMDYVNKEYVVKYNTLRKNGIELKQIINPDGKEIITNGEVNLCRAINDEYIYMYNKLYSFTTHEDICFTNTIFTTIWSTINFFNYFMEKYYGRKNYIIIQHRESYIINNEVYYKDYSGLKITRKIKNYKELRNIIVIFKILSKLICS